MRANLFVALPHIITLRNRETDDGYVRSGAAVCGILWVNDTEVTYDHKQL